MSIQFTIQSVTLQPEELQEQLPYLISMMNSCLPKRKTPKRRRLRKKRNTAGVMIQEIIDSIEK